MPVTKGTIQSHSDEGLSGVRFLETRRVFPRTGKVEPGTAEWDRASASRTKEFCRWVPHPVDALHSSELKSGGPPTPGISPRACGALGGAVLSFPGPLRGCIVFCVFTTI